jgi:hypothetical protein
MVLTERAVVRGCGDGVVRVLWAPSAAGPAFVVRTSVSLRVWRAHQMEVGLLSSTTTGRTGIGSSATGRRFVGDRKMTRKR